MVFSISIAAHWFSGVGEGLINKLIKLLELKSENDIDLLSICKRS